MLSPHITVAANRHFAEGDNNAIHWGYHRTLENNISYWKIFKETRLDLLLQFKSVLLDTERLLKLYHFKEWQKKRDHVPKDFGLFGTIWTTVAINSSKCQWHIDSYDIELTALLYFGDF